MRPITLSGFSGSNSAIDPRQLPESVGVLMTNAYPGLGDLRPLKNHTTVATVPTSPQRNTIHRMGRSAINDALYWLSWADVVTTTLGFGTDTTERTYYTGDGAPKWTNNDIGLSGGAPYPQASRLLGVPAPSTAPTVALTVDGTGTSATRYYVETFVNDLGWESAPSPVSVGVLARPGATLAISGLATPPGGSYGFTLRRIYRTQDGASGTAEFFFLREIAIGTTSTTDDARVLGELLPTEGWLPPPSTAFGIIALWNGMMALLNGKTLHISEAGFPYAYPLLYEKELKDEPVATAKWGQNLLVLTKGAPVVFLGQDPAGMVDLPPRVAQACRSARGAVGFSHGVAWPSTEGLAYIGDGGQGLLTKDILTPEQWRALNPDTMVAGRWQRFYVCSYDSGGGVLRGFMIDPLNPAGGIIYLSTGWNACQYDELADALYVLEGGNVRKFAGGTTHMAADFTSKQFLQVQPVTFGAAKVVARTYPVTLEVYAEGALKLTRSVASREGFTLPDGFMAEDWHVKVSTPAASATANNVQSIRLAARIQDFKGI
jgi:hypothetical protein